MVIGGYTLDLYCDCSHCEQVKIDTEYRTENQGFKQFTGQSNSECIWAAKNSGWKFYDNKSKCFAPGHKVK